MSGIIKVFLLLAVVACISKAQLNEGTQSCLCQGFKNGIDSKFETKEVQFYLATNFCNKVEVIVTSRDGYRFCLNPELQVVKKMITRFLRSKKNSSKPTRVSITSSTSSTSSTSTSPTSTSITSSTTTE